MTYNYEDGGAKHQEHTTDLISDEDLFRTQLIGEQERDRISSPSQLSEFQRNKLEKDAKKNWDLFYKRNGDRFFKNRYWTKHEFGELFSDGIDSTATRVDESGQLKYMLEIGCGCGNFILPLLDDESQPPLESSDRSDQSSRSPIKDLFIYCTDISEKAIEILQSNSIYKQHQATRVLAFASDITTEDVSIIQTNLGDKLMDFVSLIFVLSALDPTKMSQAVANIEQLLKPNGLVLFRDYAIYDKAMLRFNERSKISEQFYVRQDGTRAYFFTKRQLTDLFEQNNFECQSINYVRTETFNNATKDKYSRIFLQAKFRKRGSGEERNRTQL